MQLREEYYVHSAAMILSAMLLGGAICYAANRLTTSGRFSAPTSMAGEKAEVRLVFPDRLNLTVKGVIDGTHELQPSGTFTLAGPPTLNILGRPEYSAIPLKTDAGDAQGVGNVKTLRVELSNPSRGMISEPFVIRGQ